MSLQNISVLGYTDQQEQFVIRSKDIHIKTNAINCLTEEYHQPLEYLLGGFAACINAVGKQIAKDQNIDIKSIQVEIKGIYETKKIDGLKTKSRAGFKSIEIEIKPVTDASITEIKLWMDEIKERCPVYDTLLNSTPIELKVTKEYNLTKPITKDKKNKAA